MKRVLMKFMLKRDMLIRNMLTGRNNQDLHVFIGMLLFLIVAYFVGV